MCHCPHDSGGVKCLRTPPVLKPDSSVVGLGCNKGSWCPLVPAAEVSPVAVLVPRLDEPDVEVEMVWQETRTRPWDLHRDTVQHTCSPSVHLRVHLSLSEWVVSRGTAHTGIWRCTGTRKEWYCVSVPLLGTPLGCRTRSAVVWTSAPGRTCSSFGAFRCEDASGWTGHDWCPGSHTRVSLGSC